MERTGSTGNASDCDVLVIGGGPAGSCAAALLAEKGWRVVVLEKDHHPRFHIGESLLPASVAFFDRLGVREQIEKIGLRKYAGEFDSIYHGKVSAFYFERAPDKRYPYAFEVRRSEFDHVLLQNSAAKGAQVHEGVKVSGVEFRAPGEALVKATDASGAARLWKARFVVDASGRDTLLAKQFGIKEKNKKHNSAALFAHFKGAQRLSGRDEGNIRVYWFDHGWFWMIPLKDGTMSVGVVCSPAYLKSRKTGLEQFFRDTIELCPGVAARLTQAELVSPVTGTGNYSYQARSMIGENYIMLGDAFAFVDPVFSSGVHLALSSAASGAETVDACLRDPRSGKRSLLRFERTVKSRLKTFTWFIYRINSPAMRYLLMHPNNAFRLEEAVLAILAGDFSGSRSLRFPLLLFKGLYYLVSAVYLRQSYAAYRRRRRNAAEPAFSASGADA